jgi:hypothetical protein
MKSFLRENWIWIVAPIVIVLVLFAVLIALGGGDDSTFIYKIS